MQVEIKLRLADEDQHQRLAEALKPHLRETHNQENLFFDGADQELSSRHIVVRCRFYNTDKRALLTIKVHSGTRHSPSKPGGMRNGSLKWKVLMCCRASKCWRKASAEVQRWRRTLTLFMPALLLKTHKTCTHCSQTCCRRSCGKAFA